MPLAFNGLYRFDEFELDPSRRSLSRNGTAIPLSSKAFEVLTYLVVNPGRVVTKDELLKAVWPESFVEESNLPGYISALRKALTDRASYIATVPGQGYQFTERVQAVALTDLLPERKPQDLQVQQMRETTHVLIRETLTPVHALPASEPNLRRRSSIRIVLWSAVASVLLTAGAVATWRGLHPTTYGHAEIVIADLDNSTGDKDFDHTLNKVLQIDLQQSPYFSVVSDGRARRTLKAMHQPTDDPITSQLAREICQRVNGQVYLVPAIAKFGDGYQLSLQANDCGDGHTLGAAHKSVDKKSDVLAAFSDFTSKIRRSTGETRASVKEFNKPLYDEPTSSLEALKTYSEATRVGDAGKYAESIALYQHAIDLDPNFAVAYADMSTMYYNMDDHVHDKQAITKAYALRRYSNEREQFYIALRYHQSVTGNLPALLDSLRQWAGMYPSDNLPLSDLVNFETWTGQYPLAAEHAEKVLNIEQKENIHNGISYEIIGRAFHHANMPDRLRAVYAEALQWQVDTPGLHGVMLEFAAENGDQAEVGRQVAWSVGTASESRLLQLAGCAALADGRMSRAEDLFAQARSAAERDKVQDSLADLDDYHVRMLVELGMVPQAQALLKSLPAADPSLDKAFAEAEVGDKAKALAEALRRQATAPTDTLMNAEYVPSVRAAIALQEGKPEEAVALLQSSAPFELRDPTVPYLRGRAFLAARQPDAAIAEFTKLADHPWIADPSAPLIALAHLGLARAYAMQNKPGESSREYEALFLLWKNADNDLPILKQARSEYARLR